MNEKNVNKFYSFWSVASNSQSITRFDCRAAVYLPADVQECLWIQEVTGEVWTSLEQNIINTAVSEQRNCPRGLCLHNGLTKTLWKILL